MISTGTMESTFRVLVIITIGLIVVTVILMIATAIIERKTKWVKKTLAEIESERNLVKVTPCKDCPWSKPSKYGEHILWCGVWKKNVGAHWWCYCGSDECRNH